MLEKILVYLDGTEAAEEVLSPVAALAGGLGSTVTLAYVMACPECGPPPPTHRSRRVRPGDLQAGYLYLQQVRHLLEELEVASEVMIAVGHPGQILAGLAEQGADLIALPADGPFPHGSLGVSLVDLVRQTGVPLLLYRPMRHAWGSLVRRFRTVLAPLDGSALAEEALPMAEGLVSALHCRLVVPRVLPIGWRAFGGARTPTLPPPASRAEEEAALYLGGIVVGLLENGIQAQPLLLCGDPGLELVDLAHQTPESLVVMSACKECGGGPWFLGTVAHDVIYGSGIPVLLVPCRGSMEDEPSSHNHAW